MVRPQNRCWLCEAFTTDPTLDPLSSIIPAAAHGIDRNPNPNLKWFVYILNLNEWNACWIHIDENNHVHGCKDGGNM